MPRIEEFCNTDGIVDWDGYHLALDAYYAQVVAA